LQENTFAIIFTRRSCHKVISY